MSKKYYMIDHRGWREGSVVKIIGCSSKGLSIHNSSAAHNQLSSSKGSPALFWSP